jgi:hypothetical protein
MAAQLVLAPCILHLCLHLAPCVCVLFCVATLLGVCWDLGLLGRVQRE